MGLELHGQGVCVAPSCIFSCARQAIAKLRFLHCAKQGLVLGANVDSSRHVLGYSLSGNGIVAPHPLGVQYTRVRISETVGWEGSETAEDFCKIT